MNKEQTRSINLTDSECRQLYFLMEDFISEEKKHLARLEKESPQHVVTASARDDVILLNHLKNKLAVESPSIDDCFSCKNGEETVKGWYCNYNNFVTHDPVGEPIEDMTGCSEYEVKEPQS